MPAKQKTNYIIALLLFWSEASCAQAVQTARNVIHDVGAKAAESSGGLVQFARCDPRNAERDSHRCFKKYNLRLPLPLEKINPEVNDSVEGINLKDWAEFLLKSNSWHVLSGLMRPDPAREKLIWANFWQQYQAVCPSHPIFAMAKEGRIILSNTACIMYHGDEGRGRKRQPVMVSSFKSILGRGIHHANIAQKKKKVAKPFLKQKCNFIGHVYTNQFVSGVLPKHLYKKNDAAVEQLFEFGARSAEHMAKHGVAHPLTGERFWMMCVAVTGDWAFLVKCGHLSRSFYSTEKLTAGQSQKQPKGICHLCKAGQREFPFEQLSSRSPKWLSTMFKENPFKSPAPFNRIPFPALQLEDIYRFDIWHGYHLGVGKSFISSTLAVLSDHFPGRSVDERFDALSAEYLRWCKANGETAYLAYIAKETILWPSRSEVPSAIWSKGAATTVLCKWLEAWNKTADLSSCILLQKQAKACELINIFWKELFEQDVWIPGQTAVRLGDLGLQFLKLFDELAKEAFRQNRKLYFFMPKHHLLQHVFLVDLFLAGQKHQTVLLPLCWSTQMSEDFIGKAARTARRVHASTVVQRVLLRYLTKAYQEWNKLGYIKWGDAIKRKKRCLDGPNPSNP